MTRTADPYDKLAAMFLTDGNRPDPEIPAVEVGPIELAVAGHLPVRGSIWMTPYADAVAQREGTTALIRLDGDEPTIEVRGATDDDAGALLHGPGCRTVREAIVLLGPVVHTWIVRPPAGAEPPELLGSETDGAADRITILSSADQAAVTNVYKLVKELATAARATGRAIPRLGLAMIGSPRERAALQARRIDATAREHLDVSVPLTMNIAQMGSIRSTGLRSFPGQARPALADVMAWISTARGRGRSTPADRAPGEGVAPRHVSDPPPPAPIDSPADPPVVGTEAMSAGIERALEYGRTSRPAPAVPEAPLTPDVTPPAAPEVTPPARRQVIPPDAAAASPAPPAPAAAASGPASPPLEDVIRGGTAFEAPPVEPVRTPAAPAVKLPPRAVTELEPKHASPPREPVQAGQPVALAAHVPDTRAPRLRDAPGAAHPPLKPLLARCPGHERIEIALDAAGRLHVLAHEADVRGLPVVQTWVRANRELIAMAHPAETFDPKAPTVPHVFASDPLRVADLHASPIQLHLLTPVDVEGKRAWYTAPLNLPQP